MKQLTKALTFFLLIAIFHLFIYFSGAIPFFDFRFFDIISSYKTTPFTPSSSSTIVVEIDEESLQRFGQWPWSRILVAKVLQEILRQRPAAVGFDIFFPEPDRTSPLQIKTFYKKMLGLDIQLGDFPAGLEDNDLIFADVLRNGPTVLPLFASQGGTKQSAGKLSQNQFPALPEGLNLPESNHILCNIPPLQDAAHGFGYINASVDSDGIFRRQSLIISFKKRVIPNLALAMLTRIDPNLKIGVPENRWQPITISFAGKTVKANNRGEILNILYPKESFKRVSAARVASGEVASGLFTGKMVLLGASATGLYDQYITSQGNILPGVFVHASLLENILQDNSLYQPEYSKKVALGLSAFLSLLVLWLVFRRHYLLSWGLYLSISCVSLLIAWLMLERGIYISLGYFLTPFSFIFFIISLSFPVLHFIERKHFLEDLEEAHSATIDSMAMVAESRDVETGAHIIRTKEYVRLLAKTLHRNGYYREYLTPHVIDLLYRAAPLHDVGKVGIPDTILQKPGKLDENEMKIMRNHSNIGRMIIENAISNYNKTNEFLLIALNIAYSHHEKWDGSGYPLGLKGDAIPLEGRLMALADVYDALTSRRYYKEPFSSQKSEQIIINESGKHFDPVIIQVFQEIRQEFRTIYHNNQESNKHDNPIPGTAKNPLV